MTPREQMRLIQGIAIGLMCATVMVLLAYLLKDIS